MNSTSHSSMHQHPHLVRYKYISSSPHNVSRMKKKNTKKMFFRYNMPFETNK